MRGASAIESLLERTPDPQLRVFVIWEPVLATDWGAPGVAARGRVADARVEQFWDQERKLSRYLGGPAHLERIAASLDVRFRMADVIWDAVAVYPPHNSKAAFLGAPVVLVASDLPRYFNRDNAGYSDRRPAAPDPAPRR